MFHQLLHPKGFTNSIGWGFCTAGLAPILENNQGKRQTCTRLLAELYFPNHVMLRSTHQLAGEKGVLPPSLAAASGRESICSSQRISLGLSSSPWLLAALQGKAESVCPFLGFPDGLWDPRRDARLAKSAPDGSSLPEQRGR